MLAVILIIHALVFKTEAFKFPDSVDDNVINRRLDYETDDDDSDHLETESNITLREAKQIRGIANSVSALFIIIILNTLNLP